MKMKNVFKGSSMINSIDLSRFPELSEEELLSVSGGALCENIREERIKLGLTQEELGDKLFVCKQAVHNWEAGIREPNLDILKDMAAIFSTSLDELAK